MTLAAYAVTAPADRERQIAQFSPLVKRIAHHLMSRLPPSVDLGDLIQAGLIGLMDALGRYEEGQGAQFETYAAQRIRGAMLDELRQNDWLPRGARRTQKRIDNALAGLEQTLGRAPSETEIADRLGVSLEEYRDMLLQAHGSQIVMMGDFGEDGDEAEYLDRHAAQAEDTPQARLNDPRFRSALIGAIDTLPEREKMLMGLYYEQELNFKEIAAVLGVTESRICQLHGQAVSRLRGKLKEW